MAELPTFKEGTTRVKEGAQKYRIALMCAEADPMNCHRTLLVCLNLKDSELEIQHILKDGSLRSHDDLDAELVGEAGTEEEQMDMFVGASHHV